LSTRNSTLRPPSARPVLGAGLGGLDRVVISPRRITLTVSVISMISRSLWVIRMIVLPSSLQPFEDAEQLIRLGRGQHAGGLVEDQDIGLPVERLQDLDPLLVAHADILDQRVGVDVQLVFLGQLLQKPCAPWQRRAQQPRRPRRRGSRFPER
jgi:hypothetical protein